MAPNTAIPTKPIDQRNTTSGTLSSARSARSTIVFGAGRTIARGAGHAIARGAGRAITRGASGRVASSGGIAENAGSRGTTEYADGVRGLAGLGAPTMVMLPVSESHLGRLGGRGVNAEGGQGSRDPRRKIPKSAGGGASKGICTVASSSTYASMIHEFVISMIGSDGSDIRMSMGSGGGPFRFLGGGRSGGRAHPCASKST